MSSKHWLAAYGEKISCEIDPDVHGSVLELLEAAMRRYADKPADRRDLTAPCQESDETNKQRTGRIQD